MLKNVNVVHKPEDFRNVCTLTHELCDDTLARFLLAVKSTSLEIKLGGSKNLFCISLGC